MMILNMENHDIKKQDEFQEKTTLDSQLMDLEDFQEDFNILKKTTNLQKL